LSGLARRTTTEQCRFHNSTIREIGLLLACGGNTERVTTHYVISL